MKTLLSKTAAAGFSALSLQRPTEALITRSVARNCLSLSGRRPAASAVNCVWEQPGKHTTTGRIFALKPDSVSPFSSTTRLLHAATSSPDAMPPEDGVERNHLMFPKKTKKDLFLKNYPTGKQNNVRHIIPLFLLKSAISKAHLCHGDDPELLALYEDILKKCGADNNYIQPNQVKSKFYSQIAKFRFNVFVGNAKENSLLGHYGFRLFSESNLLRDQINAIGYAENQHVSEHNTLKLAETVKNHLFSALLLNSKKDQFSLQFASFIRKEFDDFNTRIQEDPGISWKNARQLLLKTVYRIRDISIFDAPQGAHEGVQATQKNHLTQAYAHLIDYATSKNADKSLLTRAFSLMLKNEEACLAFFPSKGWEDLYPANKDDKNTNTFFAREVGRALLMPTQ